MKENNRVFIKKEKDIFVELKGPSGPSWVRLNGFSWSSRTICSLVKSAFEIK